MLEDRYYMRQRPFDSWRTATVMLLIVNAVVFLVQVAVERTSFPIGYYFALSVNGLAHGKVWQLVTYQFLHGGWLHLALNCWAIYVFGKEMEVSLGVRKYLTLYLLSGVAGGLVQIAAGLVLGGWFAAPVVGASAGAFGLVAAFATLHPERPLMLLLFFFIPVRMRAKTLLLFCGIVAVVGILFPGGSDVAHAAHLGGMLFGIFFIRYALDWHWPQLRLPRPKPRPLVRVQSDKAVFLSKSNPIEDLPAEEFLSREVDPILDKISAHGIQSLTERERRILEAARAKMAKR